MNGWIHKAWSIQTMEYYSALNRNELSSHESHGGNEREKPTSRGHSALCDRDSVVLEKAKLSEAARGCGRGRDRRGARGCKGNEAGLHDTETARLWLHTRVQTPRTHTAASERSAYWAFTTNNVASPRHSQKGD